MSIAMYLFGLFFIIFAVLGFGKGVAIAILVVYWTACIFLLAESGDKWEWFK